MKIRVQMILFAWLLMVGVSAPAGLFEPAEVVRRMEKAAQWQIDHPTRFGALEWHCAPFWGINNGLLDRAIYEPAVRNGWAALCKRQKESGRLVNSQPVGGYPTPFDPDTTTVFSMGTFISAGSEVWKLVQD